MSEYLDIPALYGSSVFSEKEMRARLPREIYKRLSASMAAGEELDPTVADAVASAMKEWAIEQGATHYTHWFQPLTGTTAEKHDSFISPQKDGSVIMELVAYQASGLKKIISFVEAHRDMVMALFGDIYEETNK